MKRAQILGLSIAGGAGLLAFIGMQMLIEPPQQRIVEASSVNTTKVLVARTDIGLGALTTNASFRWQEWPRDAVDQSFITYDRNPNGQSALVGAVARSPVVKGEPVTSRKLIKAGKGGILAAILPAGKRAVSTRITEQSAVGKMILPNDHVDVILSKRGRSPSGRQTNESITLFRNIRVLAIGQQIDLNENRKDAQGNVATLELTPEQAEALVLANTTGEISLTLRSIVDTVKTKDDEYRKKDRPTAIKIIRYGQSSRAYTIN
ncbi:MAG: Flp pilus assembly protein CpaB [Pseudomonadota bacterium]